ncbi:cobalamin biosynthesis protein [Paraburkholderia sp. RL17-337-BIB-A]|uniref:cobalamin biosynthesis protein n=1 Tax=Paraburkholderia sp. RL17-337-BIB-A TaxID=3031636 RepID=UPI0038BD4A97
MKTLTVGIGCRLHSSAEQIEAAVRATLGSHAFDEISTIASVDTKAHEAGLLEFCARHALPLKLFSREQIAAISVDNPSTAAREHLGVDGVCEPCALLAALGDLHVTSSTPHAAHASVASAALDAAVAPNASLAPLTSIAPAPLTARLLARKTVHNGITVAIASTTARPAREQTNTDPHQ